MFFEQPKTAKDLANVIGRAHMDVQLISIAFSLVFSQGVLNDACCTWDCHPTAEDTWDNFIQHFTEAHQELTKLQLAAK
eukprot:4722118-Ditylum_brightwellii.AAC.1